VVPSASQRRTISAACGCSCAERVTRTCRGTHARWVRTSRSAVVRTGAAIQADTRHLVAHHVQSRDHHPSGPDVPANDWFDVSEDSTVPFEDCET
jgi:hypothetical protein